MSKISELRSRSYKSYAANCATVRTPILKPFVQKKIYVTTKYGLLLKRDPNQNANELRRTFEDAVEGKKYPTCARKEDTVACEGGVVPCNNCGTYMMKLEDKRSFVSVR